MATETTIQMIPIADVVPYDKNPRVNSAAVDPVAESIERFGFRVPVLLDKNNVIIAGHTRLKAAEKLGMTEVPCIICSDMKPDQIRAFRLADNRVAQFAEWDAQLLRDEVDALLAVGMELDGLGFSEADMTEICGALSPDGVAMRTDDELDDAVPAVPDDPASKLGEVYQLGRHRLMCGDATSAEDVTRVLGGKQADLLLTDPPYNVDYEGCTADKLKIVNDSMASEQFSAFLSRAFAAAVANMEPGAAFYVFHASRSQAQFEEALNDAGLEVRQQLIWAKNVLVIGRQDYQWKHEPIFYGWLGGAAHKWNSDRSQTTVLEFDRPSKNTDHPTMKPVALLKYLMCNSSDRDAVVLDSFGGSGSTLVAAEASGRTACLLELDPRYCDVIRRRWATAVHGADADWQELTPRVDCDPYAHARAGGGGA